MSTTPKKVALLTIAAIATATLPQSSALIGVVGGVVGGLLGGFGGPIGVGRWGGYGGGFQQAGFQGAALQGGIGGPLGIGGPGLGLGGPGLGLGGPAVLFSANGEPFATISDEDTHLLEELGVLEPVSVDGVQYPVGTFTLLDGDYEIDGENDDDDDGAIDPELDPIGYFRQLITQEDYELQYDDVNEHYFDNYGNTFSEDELVDLLNSVQDDCGEGDHDDDVVIEDVEH